MSEHDEKPRVVDAEIVREPEKAPQRVDVERVQEGSLGGMRWATRARVIGGDGEVTEEALRRARGRFGVVAVISLLTTAGFIYLAVTTESVLLAAICLIMGILAGLVAMVFGAVWRLIGRLTAAPK
jgi:hypothetical protein